MKRIFLALCLLVMLSMGQEARAAAPADLYLEGQSVGRAVLVDGTSYLPLRTAADFYGGSIDWQVSSRTARYVTEGLELTARDGQAYITANGRALHAPGGVFIQNGRLMIPVRLLAQALGGQARWDAAARSVSVTAGSGRIEPGSRFYDADALLWLARIISAESRGEPLNGQVAVGNVILNRVASPDYPNTIYGVIFDRKHGVQFEPVLNGTVWDEPAESAVAAAKLCLEGVDLSRGCIYFYNPALAQNNWIGQNREYVMTIGTHRFYR